MSHDPKTETERLVQAILADAASGARATVDLLRDQVSRVAGAERDVLLGLIRASAPQPKTGYGA
jgi:hypothetical protein